MIISSDVSDRDTLQIVDKIKWVLLKIRLNLELFSIQNKDQKHH